MLAASMISMFLAMSQQQAPPQIVQHTTGFCSPALANINGNVSITCIGVDPRALRRLNKELDRKNLQLDEKIKEANDWAARYKELEARLNAGSDDVALSREAGELLKAGKLDEAGRVLDEVLASGEKEIDEIAKAQYERATLYELQFLPLQALPHYEKACNYRPNNPDYCPAYADLLLKEGDFAKAEPLYKEALGIRRELARTNPAYLPDVARTLNNLGALYSKTQRLMEGADAYTKALQTFRELAKQTARPICPTLLGR